MKVVVSATDRSIDAPMDQRFGRAPWFVLVDTETGEWSAHANAAVESGHGAGIEASRTVAGLGAEASSPATWARTLTAPCRRRASSSTARAGRRSARP